MWSNDLYYTVRTAIDSGIDAKQFIQETKEHWNTVLEEKKASDARVFDKAIYPERC